MAWEWSNGQEAYALARRNLGGKSIKFLAECYAEWRCKDIDDERKKFEGELFSAAADDDEVMDIPPLLCTSPFNDGRYEHFLKVAKDIANTTCKDVLADVVWGRAEQGATCENGGCEPWVCPDGCHRVEW